MINPDQKQVEALAYVCQNVPAVQAWLENWRAVELARLPNISTTTVAVAQGRCQVLGELCKALEDAPSMAANPNRGKLPVQPRTPTGA